METVWVVRFLDKENGYKTIVSLHKTKESAIRRAEIFNLWSKGTSRHFYASEEKFEVDGYEAIWYDQDGDKEVHRIHRETIQEALIDLAIQIQLKEI